MSEPKEVQKRTKFRGSLIERAPPEWEKDPHCVDWLARVSPKTAKSIRYSFVMFLGFVEKSPTQIYKERIEDLRADDPMQRGRWESEIVKFKNILVENDYTENSVKSMIGRVQSFFKHNLISLSFPRGWLKVRESDFAKTQHKKRLRLTNIQLRKMYSYAETIEARLTFLLMVQNGLGPSTISKLRIEMIPVKEDTPELDEETGSPTFVFFETDRSKTGVDVDTFLSGEVIHDLKIHLDKRGWPKTGYLFEARTGKAIRADYISQWIKDLSVALGEEFDPYNLRHYFHQSLENARVPDYHKRALMGHVKRGAEGAYLGGIEGLLESYRTAFPRLSVNGVAQTRGDMKELKLRLGNSEESIKKLEERQLKLMRALFSAESPKAAVGMILDDELGLPAGTSAQRLMRMTKDQLDKFLESAITQKKERKT